MIRDPNYQRLGGLFRGAAAGAYTLPDDLLALERRARGAVDALAAPDNGPTLNRTRGEYHQALVSAIDAGAELPDPIVLAEAEARDRALAERRRLLVDLAEAAQSSVVAGVQAQADELIVDHLRPALDEALEGAGAVADKLGATLPTTDELLNGTDANRKAYKTLRALAGRYRALRSAQSLVVAVSGKPKDDTGGLFVELRNLPDVWPGRRAIAVNPAAAAPPWPDDELGRLLWLVTSDAEPWMPTAADQDAVFRKRFPRQDTAA